MTTALFTHAACADHVTPDGHPERVDRIKAVWAALEAPIFDALVRQEAPRASLEALLRVHPEAHISNIKDSAAAAGAKPTRVDPDTSVVAGSWEAALRAAGAVCAAVDEVMSGKAQNAFCAVRPPGHHAEAEQSMGFCLFNNVAIAAYHARAAHGIERVAVIDFDVHHGNGTEAIFAGDKALFYGSTHQMPLYPGTGDPAFRGVGNIINAPMAPDAGSVEFRQVMTDIVLPALESFAPELIMISAGFDAHADDPLAQINLNEDDYVWITNELCDVAERCCERRIVSTLEGGYDLEALSASVSAHVAVLMEQFA